MKVRVAAVQATPVALDGPRPSGRPAGSSARRAGRGAASWPLPEALGLHRGQRAGCATPRARVWNDPAVARARRPAGRAAPHARPHAARAHLLGSGSPATPCGGSGRLRPTRRAHLLGELHARARAGGCTRRVSTSTLRRRPTTAICGPRPCGRSPSRPGRSPCPRFTYLRTADFPARFPRQRDAALPMPRDPPVGREPDLRPVGQRPRPGRLTAATRSSWPTATSTSSSTRAGFSTPRATTAARTSDRRCT